MAVYQVQSNGQAPPGLSAGDYVNTAGGMYYITQPGALGANYNPASGYWSIPTNSEAYAEDRRENVIRDQINAAQEYARQNTQTSQEFAERQMEFQNASAQQAMQFSAEQAQINRNWQERLSSSAHQREVADLVAAGLNPILSANHAGASTPSGASAAGVTSSGAQGTVDTSAQVLAANLLANLVSNQTSMDISKLQAATTMYAADRGYAGTTGAAGINAASAWRLQDDAQAFQEYVYRNYPDNPYRAAAAAVKAGSEYINSNHNGNAVDAAVNVVRKIFPNAFPGYYTAGDWSKTGQNEVAREHRAYLSSHSDKG